MVLFDEKTKKLTDLVAANIMAELWKILIVFLYEEKKNLFFAFLYASLWAQQSRDKTLRWKPICHATQLQLNLGVEFGVAPKWTIDLSGNYNPFYISHSRKWKHWLVQPEARYWFCDRFASHFIGFHALGGQYNFANLKNDVRLFGTDFSQLTDHRLQGWFAGGGVAYGYSWVLGRRWNLGIGDRVGICIYQVRQV